MSAPVIAYVFVLLPPMYKCSLLLCLTLCNWLTARAQNDIRFLTGSCAYVGPNDGDTSLYVYNGDTNILYSLSQKEGDFMLWLGDNWYLDYPEWETAEGLRKKAQYARTVKTTQPIRDMGKPEYAVWDDHDYGPNQSQRDFPLKKVSREVFMETWKDNPSFGENGEGVYTSFRKGDVQFILLDDRWWRDHDHRWKRKWFKPNPNKRMFGRQQMEWLKRELRRDSSLAFRIVVNGSQVLNPWAKGDCLSHFPIEYNELIGFLAEEKTEGVIFLSGDTHFSEIIRLNRPAAYPLYDITVSPLTSTVAKTCGRERRNKYRVPGTLIEAQNFAQWHISGSEGSRKIGITFFDKYGRKINEWSVNRSELTYK